MTNPLKNEYDQLAVEIMLLSFRKNRPRSGPRTRAEHRDCDLLETLKNRRNELCQQIFGVTHGTRDKEFR